MPVSRSESAAQPTPPQTLPHLFRWAQALRGSDQWQKTTCSGGDSQPDVVYTASGVVKCPHYGASAQLK